MAKRQLVLLGLAMALAGGGRAQQQMQEQGALGELFSGDASVRGAVLLHAQATQVLSGSQIAAGDGIALLKLKRGGQVRICPRTKLSLNADSAGKALALGLDAGAMELHYQLESGADSLLTPDFRLQLISPGIFHLAISVSPSGDTCLHSLPGADAAIFVTEMMGEESYQLSPGKKVLFRKGKIAEAAEALENCGCAEPAPAPALLARNDVAQNDVAQNGAPSAAPGKSAAPEKTVSSPHASIPSGAQQLAAPLFPGQLPQLVDPGQPRAEKAKTEHTQPETAPAEAPAAAHLDVRSRFDYRGDQAAQDYYTAVARLSLSTDNSKLALSLLPQIPPFPQASARQSEVHAAAPEASGGFLHRLGSALRHMFGGH